MRYVLTSLMIVAVCGAAEAQTASESLLLDRTAVAQGEVVVRDDRGSQIRGTLIGMSDDRLELLTRGGPRRLNLSSVTRVMQPGDPIVDGVLRGMGTALVWCVLMCEHTVHGDVRAGSLAGHLAVGGLIGGAVDRAVNRGRTIYQRQPPAIHIGIGPRQGSVTVVF